MKHLTSIQLCAFLDDALVGAPGDQTARHIASCAMCRARYEAWCHVDDSLRELLGQVPDEWAMEQRTSWVEIAVSAERKGLPAPEFADLRIPLASPPPPRMMAPMPSPIAPPLPAPVTPQAPRAGMTPPPAAAPVPDPRMGKLRPPVLHAPPPPPPPVHAPSIHYTVAPVAPREVAPPPAIERHAKPETAPVLEPAAGAKTADGKKAANKKGYARMPRGPRRGLAALLARPGFWLGLALVAGIAVALPKVYKRYGLPELTLSFPGRDGGHAGKPTDRDAKSEPARDHDKDGTVVRRSTSSSRVKANTEPPDASILFDLPALEPEDGEPDPDDVAPAPKKSSSTAATAGSTPMLCGEVRTPQGAPIEGARVSLTVPAKVVRTDRRGHFCITCPPGQRTLRIEATGRVTVTRNLKLGRERLEARFTLAPAR